MKIPVLLLTLGMLTSSLVTGNAAPLLQYKFDQSGAVQQSTGSQSLDLTVRNGSGAPTDYITTTPDDIGGTSSKLALNFTGSNVEGNKGAAQASINSTDNPYLRDGLGSFTVSAWVLDVNPAGLERRVFTLRDTGSNQSIVDIFLYADRTLGLTLRGVNGVMALYNTAVKVPLSSDEWNFIAVSYDAATGNASLYSGVEGGTLTSRTEVNTTTGALLKSATVLSVGNVGYEHERRLNGYLSDVQFFGAALDTEEIGALYAVPEPTVSMLVGGSVLAFLLKNRKR